MRFTNANMIYRNVIYRTKLHSPIGARKFYIFIHFFIILYHSRQTQSVNHFLHGSINWNR